MSRPIINYVDRYDGRCGLTTDTPAEVIRRLGTDNVRFVRPATESEIEWVRGMGGEVPGEDRISKAATKEAA